MLWNDDVLTTAGLNGSGLVLNCQAPVRGKGSGLYLFFGLDRGVDKEIALENGTVVSLQTSSNFLIPPQFRVAGKDGVFFGPLSASALATLTNEDTVTVVVRGKAIERFGIKDSGLLSWFTSQCERRRKFDSSTFPSGTILKAYRDREFLFTRTTRWSGEQFASNGIVRLLLLLSRGDEAAAREEVLSFFRNSDDTSIKLINTESEYIFAADGAIFLSHGFLDNLIRRTIVSAGLNAHDVSRWVDYVKHERYKELEFELNAADLNDDNLSRQYANTLHFVLGHNDVFESVTTNVGSRLQSAYLRFFGATRLIGLHELAHLKLRVPATDCASFRQAELDADAWAIRRTISYASQFNAIGRLAIGDVLSFNLGAQYFFEAARDLERASSSQDCDHPHAVERLRLMQGIIDASLSRTEIAEGFRRRFFERLKAAGIERDNVAAVLSAIESRERPEFVGLEFLTEARLMHRAFLIFVQEEMKEMRFIGR